MMPTNTKTTVKTKAKANVTHLINYDAKLKGLSIAKNTSKCIRENLEHELS